MSLRNRLTFFYSLVMGVFFIVFGVAVYTATSLILIRQVDNTLEKTVLNILELARFDQEGQIGFVAPISFDPQVEFQVWSVDGSLMDAANTTSFDQPLDEMMMGTDEARFSEIEDERGHYRVWTVPVNVNNAQVGTVQAGVKLSGTDAVLGDLFRYIIGVGGIVMVLAGLVSWVTVQRTLMPLTMVTATALKITNADNLSMRIPQSTHRNDEITQLIEAFNLTLSRLEEVFVTQRRFLADVGHELRTPLTVLKGNIDLLRRLDEDVDPEILGIMDDEINRLNRLINDILLLARAESGKLPLDMQQVALDTVVLEVMQQAMILAEGKKDIVLNEFDQVMVMGDRDRLLQVFLNLMSNAVKYTPIGGKVEISLVKENGKAKVVVKDNGPGISPDDLPHIFERFYRADQSRNRVKSDAKGFGLGLSIAYWIVRNHDGVIEASSVLDQGTTFTVWLNLI